MNIEQIKIKQKWQAFNNWHIVEIGFQRDTKVDFIKRRQFYEISCQASVMSKSITQTKKITINNFQLEMKYKGVLIEQISLFKHPLIYLDLLLKVILDTLKSIKDLFVTRFLLFLIIITVWILLSTVDSLYSIKAFILFALYWIVLGVASSIGLGTGLHTFVLYLGPHIAKVAIIASSCGHMPEMIPSRWQFDHFGSCNTGIDHPYEENTNQKITFFGILLAVQLQSFFWGLGTALGQLPPYFAAYKASKTKYELSKMQQIGQRKSRKIKADQEKIPLVQQQKEQEQPVNSSESIHPPKISQQQLENQQINQIEHLKQKPDLTLLQKAKILIFENMQKYGFITILLCASIPNPLFDLAGITCGHFRIPFKKFFIPTFIGKAIIKVHIQMLFTLDILMGWIRSVNQSLSETLLKGFQKQKQAFYHPKDVDVQSKPIVGMLWDLFLTVMIGYFLFSIVSGLIQEKAIQMRDLEQVQERKNIK